MKRLCLVLALVGFLTAGCEKKGSGPEAKKEGAPAPKVTAEKERVEREDPFPPEVKIKLRRDGKENYSWELSGSDVNQILKVNERLSKQLGKEQPK